MNEMTRTLQALGCVEINDEAREIVGGGLSITNNLSLIIVVCAKVDKASPPLF